MRGKNLSAQSSNIKKRWISFVSSEGNPDMKLRISRDGCINEGES
jgi:hypothetical protein